MNPLADILDRLAAGQIPAELPTDCDCREELQRLVNYLDELTGFVKALSAGEFQIAFKLPGPLAGSLKGLHANLRHLTWQTQQVAAGDFSQRVDFLGEFSAAFNSMVAALDQARKDLIEKNKSSYRVGADCGNGTLTLYVDGQQIASVGKIIQVQTSYLQFPLAAANAVVLLAIVLMIIWALTRMVDIRKEL